MPQPYNQAVITDKGMNLLTRAQAGEVKIEFTRVAIGAGTYELEEKQPDALKGQESLKEEKNSYAISGIDVSGNHSVRIKVLITNLDPATKEVLVSSGYYINEIGLYAKEKDGLDDTEVLYSMAVTSGEKGDFMPPYNGHNPTQIIQEYYATVSNFSEVTVQCNMGATALADDLFRVAENVKEIQAPEFTQAEERENIESKDSLPTIFGKIKKFFADLKQVAFTGSYNDLSNKPTIPAAVRVKGDAETTYHTGDVNITPANIGLGDVGNFKAVSTASQTLSETEKSNARANIGAAPTSHASTATTYGASSATNYGHAMASSTTPKANGTATAGTETAKFARGDHVHPLQTSVTGSSGSCTGNATSATKATQDGNGNNIVNTYAKKSIYGDNSMSCGARTGTVQSQSITFGYNGLAENFASAALGKYNKAMSGGGNANNQMGDVLVVGNGYYSGSAGTIYSNALRITSAGDVMGTKAFQSSGADYAEHTKEWADGNPDGEDRVGYMVTVKGGLLYKAQPGDYIAGITSGNPSVVGNADEDYYWKYERDEFNRIVMEDVPEMVQQTDEDGNPVFDEETHETVMVETGNIIKNARMKLADGYDSSLQDSYVPRADRKEWDYVGMRGMTPVRDDGTCLQDHFCKCGVDGIATLAETRGFDTFYVIERISDNVVCVFI